MIEIQARKFEGLLFLLGLMADAGVETKPVGGNRFTICDESWEDAKHALADAGGALVSISGHPDPLMTDAFTRELHKALTEPIDPVPDGAPGQFITIDLPPGVAEALASGELSAEEAGTGMLMVPETLMVPEGVGEEQEAAGEGEPEEDAEGELPDRPPVSGPGSGRDAWVTYAEALGFEVDGDMSRDEIISLTEDAG